MDVASFISAIVSAAAGIYSVGLTGERSIDIDLTFQPNQIVRVRSSSTSTALGNGTLTISRDSELTLAYITVNAPIEVRAGALLTLEGVRFASEGCIKVEDESQSTVVLDDTPAPPVCASDCGEIEHCEHAHCATSEVAVCDLCEDGYYIFRHNYEQGHCIQSDVTLLQAGFGLDAVGVFDLRSRSRSCSPPSTGWARGCWPWRARCRRRGRGRGGR